MKGVTNGGASVDFHAGGVKHQLNSWKSINAPKQVLSYITGVVFYTDVPKTVHLPINTVLSIQEHLWIKEEITRLLKMGAIVECQRSEIHLLSPLKVVPKKTQGEFRLVVNMRKLNSYMVDYSSKLENVDSLLKAMKPNCYFMKVDLKNGYFHVPIATECTKYMGIHFNGKYYKYHALPFGASFAPFVFNKVTKSVSSYLRQQGILTLVYLDDFVFIFDSMEDAIYGRSVILQLFKDLGLTIHTEKSILVPAQVVEFLGFQFSSVDMSIKIPQQKLVVLQNQIQKVIGKSQESMWFVAREIASIAGKVLAYMKAFAPARLMMRPLFRILQEISASGRSYCWNFKVMIDQEVISKLKWVSNNLQQWNGVSVVKPSRVIQLFSDASSTGYGFHCLDISFQGIWSKEDCHKSINWKELKAFELGLAYCSHMIRGKKVQGFLDSMVAVAYLNKMGGSVKELSLIAESIWMKLLQLQAYTLEFQYIQSADNVLADLLSRGTDIHDWTLCDKTWLTICATFGTPSIDRFANVVNKKLPRFNSLLQHKSAEGWDALAQDWQGEYNYVCAPFGLLDRIVQHIIECKAKTIMIIPVWKGQIWYQKLLPLILQWIPLTGSDFQAGKAGYVEPHKNPAWQFQAVLVHPQ